MTELKEFNLAAIDVGSNASRLVIKTVGITVEGQPRMRKALFLRVPLRLGAEVFKGGGVGRQKEEEFLRTMKAFRQLMKVFHVSGYRACCTSAVREAKNGQDVVERICKGSGLKLEIITGDEESQIICDSHLDMFSGKGNFMYVDVGGGSTETTFMSDGKRIYSRSWRVGTVRILDGGVSHAKIEEMKQVLSEVTRGYKDIQIIGSGGNINKLCEIAGRKEKQAKKLLVETLRRMHDRLSKMSMVERMDVFDMKPDRADVIVPAAEIFLLVAGATGAEIIQVPGLGLADGLINDQLKQILDDQDRKEMKDVRKDEEKIARIAARLGKAKAERTEKEARRRRRKAEKEAAEAAEKEKTDTLSPRRRRTAGKS